MIAYEGRHRRGPGQVTRKIQELLGRLYAEREQERTSNE